MQMQLRLLFFDNNQFKNDIERVLGSPDLIRAQTLCIYELIEDIIVDKHQNFVLAALEIVSLDLKSLKDC